MEKLLTRYPALRSKIIFEVNLYDRGKLSIAASSLQSLRLRAEQLTKEILQITVTRDRGRRRHVERSTVAGADGLLLGAPNG